MSSSLVEAINQYGFPIVAAMGLGYFVFYVWKWVTTEIKPVLGEASSTLIALIDRIRMLDNDMIRLTQKIQMVLEFKEQYEKLTGKSLDLDLDQIYLSTIPQKIGVRNTKIIGYALLGDALLLEFFKHQFDQNRFLIVVFLVVILILFLAKSTPKRSRYYTAFWVEAIPILTLGILWIMVLIQKA